MSTTTPSREIIDRGLNVILDGVEDLADWCEEFRSVFEIIDREAGENVAAVAAEEKLFQGIHRAMAALAEYRLLRCEQ